MVRKMILALVALFTITFSSKAQTNLLEQAGVKNWMSGKGSITELGNSYYIVKRTMPAALDTSLLPANNYPTWDPIQLLLSKYNKYTMQLEATTTLVGDTLQQDSLIYETGRICIHKGRIHFIFDKVLRDEFWPTLYHKHTYYMQLDTNLNITVPERRVFTGDFNAGRALTGMDNDNVVYIGTGSNSLGYCQNYYIIDTSGNFIESGILGYGLANATPWVYAFERYGTNKYVAYGNNLLGVAQSEKDNSFLITDNHFNVIDTFSTQNTSALKMVATPKGALFTLSGYFNALTEIGKYTLNNNFEDPSFFKSYGIDAEDQIHAAVGLSYNPYDHKIYSVSGTHKVDPYLFYCYFPATPQALQFPYGYSEIICVDTNLSLQWKKYIRIDQHTGGCGGPWYGIVPDGRAGINIAGGWYNENYDGNGKDTINEFLYYITATTSVDSTILPGTSIDEQGIEIRDRVKIYPNPSTNTLWIDDIEGKLNEIEVYDIQGRRIIQQQISHTKASINISGLPSGLYLAKVTTKDGETIQKKILKQ